MSTVVRADDGDYGGGTSRRDGDGLTAERDEYGSLYGFTSRLRRVFGLQILLFLVSSNFLVKGAARHLVQTTFLPYAQQYLKFTAQAFQRFEVLAMFPWMIKPLVGLVTDTTPIFRYRKRYYIAFVASVGSVAIYFLATKDFQPEDNMEYTGLVMAVNVLFAFSDTLVGARVFEAMSLNQHVGGDLMSWDWFMVTIGSLLGTLSAWTGLEKGNYKMIFWLALPCAVQLIFVSGFGMMPEDPVKEGFNTHALARKHWNLMAVTFTVTIMSICTVSMQLVDDFERNFGLTFLCCTAIMIIIISSLWIFLEKRAACLLIFVAIERFLCVNVKQAKAYWYTTDSTCVPNGPHFSYVFYNVITFSFALLAQAIGIWVFQQYFSRSKIRLVFLINSLAKIFAKLTDVWIILRLNVKMGIDDRSAYVLGESVIEGIALVMTYMPAAAVLSKVVDKEIECTMFTLLAGIVNIGHAISATVGASAMTYAGIHTDLVEGECNFDQLIPLLVVSGVALPLFAIPLIYLFIPDWNMHDDFNKSEIQRSVEKEAIVGAEESSDKTAAPKAGGK